MWQNFETIAKKLFRLVILRLVVSVTALVFGPNAKPADAQCSELDDGKELPVADGCGKRRVAVQTRPNGIVFVGLFLSEEGTTRGCLAEAARWRQMLLDEIRALDEREGLGGWAEEHVRVFVSQKNDERSEVKPLITADT
ncbi:MAG: hypothetical protein A3B37_03325 [Candidatus Sungbacteria bacterium RIFCSPLOWO2_01_FULL_59_16]|uniref:Uncharacterized protein n=1 Tax=Candidatus Sungbacteria bacterium RIFCSPLOWO2_01_FULL_59_16 TaxID=1802280 RepID=A0A1G2L9B8_9BACT|nr:MAG: hypothetical protein A3B37_03325 [Candidatus Sungbacteria bacterium RIFCSPLOWO2_01_FULL_59_16]